MKTLSIMWLLLYGVLIHSVLTPTFANEGEVAEYSDDLGIENTKINDNPRSELEEDLDYNEDSGLVDPNEAPIAPKAVATSERSYTTIYDKEKAKLKRVSISAAATSDSYSGHLDVGILDKLTLGLHYQNLFGNSGTTKKVYKLNGVKNYGLNLDFFPLKNQRRFETGLVLSAGIHQTAVSSSSNHTKVIFGNKETLIPGSKKLGYRLAGAYRFYYKNIHLGLGPELFTVGKSTEFLPFRLSLGVAF